MDTEESKKRRMEESPPNSAKRQCQQDTPENIMLSSHNDSPEVIVPSVEDMIAVPLDFIFREVPQTSIMASTQPQRHKPLLSRTEAQCFLNIALLAHEMDSLVQVSAQALEQKRKYSSLVEKLQARNDPFLRALLPLLHVLGQYTPNESLRRIQMELDRVVTGLKSACESLRQFSEQNWTLSESLLDAMSGTSGEVVAKEKRRLSDVQEEVCNRIDTILQVTEDSEADVFQSQVLSMRDYCTRVVNQEPPTSPPASQQSELSHSERKKEPVTEEKENHSQQQQVIVEDMGTGENSQESPTCRTQNAAEVLSALATRGWGDHDAQQT